MKFKMKQQDLKLHDKSLYNYSQNVLTWISWSPEDSVCFWSHSGSYSRG